MILLIDMDFLGALKNPSTTERYNWGRYVYCNLLDAAQKVCAEIISKGRACYISRWLSLLSADIFPDNVDLKRLNKPHNILPRMKVFDADSLKKMTLMCASRGENDLFCFIGVSML
ncbi:hypothetical protein GQ55_3G486500 [Panicum hallii var. hallii]|jgi:hypothetical protein|uniref:Uncharacterized protein n=1 Tax=Panicum hallii var. hallii TaxID=1504633 RepID=A0A2T7EJT6_9POAL|nr:hypothetical protein GQ55_3G486500 [Panicum hallii var. hallii]